MKTYIPLAVGIATVAMLAGVAVAGPSKAQKCEAAKLKEVAKYDACRLKAQAKAVTKTESPDFTKCDGKFADGWAKAESKAGGQCPTTGDESSIGTSVIDHVNAIAAALASTCGNGVIDAGEQCDGTDLGTATCQSLGFDTGTLTCTSSCTLDSGSCLSTCDPLLQDCASGQGCYILNDTTAVCATAGSNTAGTSCMYVNDCQPGYFCGDAGSGPVCIQMCSVSSPVCPIGQACVSAGWTANADLGGCL